MRQRLPFILRPSLGLKRWLTLIFVGLLCLALGGAYLLTALYRQQPWPAAAFWLTLQWIPHWVRGLLFLVAGAALTWIGWQRLSRALVDLLAPELAPQGLTRIVQTRTREAVGRPVVVLGGGSGIAPVVQALQRTRAPLHPRVVLAPTESARVATLLRNTLGLSSSQIILSTADEVSLWAEMVDGTLLEGPRAIQQRSGGQVQSLFVSRDLRRMRVWENLHETPPADVLRSYAPEVNAEALAVLKAAHLIVLAPGKLYTDLLPLLTLPHVAEAVRASGAPVVFVANLMVEPGPTASLTVGEYLTVIRERSGIDVDYVIVNETPLSAGLLAKYEAEGSEMMRVRSDMTAAVSKLTFADGRQTMLVEGAIVVGAPLVSEAPQQITVYHADGSTAQRELPVARHDPDTLAPLLEGLLRPA